MSAYFINLLQKIVQFWIPGGETLKSIFFLYIRIYFLTFVTFVAWTHLIQCRPAELSGLCLHSHLSGEPLKKDKYKTKWKY